MDRDKLIAAVIEDAAASLATPGSPMYWQITKTLEAVEALGYAKAIEDAVKAAEDQLGDWGPWSDADACAEQIAAAIRALAGKDAEA